MPSQPSTQDHSIAALPVSAVREGRATRLSLQLSELGVVLAFCCSSMLLTHIGYHYDHSGGLPFEKFHPASLMLLSALACLMVGGGAFQVAARTVKDHPLTTIYVACVAYYAVYVAIILGRPVTFVVDTLIGPALAFVLLRALDSDRLDRIARFIHAFMAINALIGISEAILQWHLIPIYSAGALIDYDELRATALLGHPLQNAAITAVYGLLLLTGPRGTLRPVLALPLFGLQLLALPAFGGRTAAVLLAVLSVGWVVKNLLLTALGKPFPLTRVIWLCLGLPLAAIVVSALLDTTYFMAFIERFIDDSGSAETRVRMLRLFDGFSWGDLFIGPDPAMLEHLQFREGTELGIESFPVAYILTSGIFAASLVFIGLAVFVFEIARTMSLRITLAVLMFIALNASSTGLSSKGIAFTLVIAIIISMEGVGRRVASRA